MITMSTGLAFLHHNHHYNIPTNTSASHTTWAGGMGTESEGEGRREVLEAIPFVQNELDGGWFGRIGTSVSLFLGTFGNVMIIVILSRLRSGWSAMNLYLTSLAVSDTASMYTATFAVWTRKMFRYDLFASHIVVCKGGIWITNSSASLSAWLLVALTLQRAASVISPHRVNLICTHRKSIIVIILIVILCFLLYSHTLYGFDLVTIGDNVHCTFGYAEYQQFWVNVWVRVDMFIYSFLPCAFLVGSNAVLGWKLAVTVQDARHKLSGGGKTGSDLRKKKASSATVTIIIVSCAFIFLTVPLMAYNSFFQDYAAQDQDSRTFHYFLYDFFFVVGMSNFTWNFYLYCLTGSKFRQEFVRIMTGCCQRRPLTLECPVSGTDQPHVQQKQTVDGPDDF